MNLFYNDKVSGHQAVEQAGLFLVSWFRWLHDGQQTYIGHFFVPMWPTDNFRRCAPSLFTAVVDDFGNLVEVSA